MEKLEHVIKGLEESYQKYSVVEGQGILVDHDGYEYALIDPVLIIDALAMLKAQEQRHRLEVHNIGNVDIPDGVTEEQFYALMNNVVAALGHTDMGESWPYDDKRR